MSNSLRKFLDDLQKLIFNAETTAPATHARTIASTQLLQAVREHFESMNQQAYKVDASNGMVYMDWDEYYSVLDVYYDDDGALFAVCQQAGKLYRLPIDVNGDTVSFGALEEIPLSGSNERALNHITVVRQADGSRRWFAIASSAVLNRVNEIDSVKLFKNFVKRADESKKYPFLTFYHHGDVLRLGQADWVAQEGFLYLAAGTFADNADGQRAADTLERETDDWGTSIGYLPTEPPEFLEVIPGVIVPVYNDGINEEISIVLERDAADRFTRMSAEEKNRTMKKTEKAALVRMFGQERADEMERAVDGTNRSITEQNLVRRETANAGANETTANAAEATNVAANAVVDTPTNAQAEPAQTATANASTTETAAAAQVEITETDVVQLADALLTTPKFSQLWQMVQDSAKVLTELPGLIQASAAAQRSALSEQSERIDALERSDVDKQREWVSDLPHPTVRKFTFRPSHERGAANSAVTEDAVLDLSQVADQTVSALRTRSPHA